MAEKRYFMKEMVTASGLTTRTLQHYDNIGLLPVSGRTEGGRRFYTESDLVKLEQIIFYKSLGFSLQEIQEKLINTSESQAMEKLLSEQAKILFFQIEMMHTSLAAIEACRQVIKANRVPPWDFLSSAISKLDQKDFHSWDFSTLKQETIAKITEHFTNLDDLMALFHTWKALTIKAAVFQAAGISPQDPVAQEIAKEWLQMAQFATGGKEELLDAFLEIDHSREIWPEGARQLMERADDYLDECYKLYCALNHLEPNW